MREVKHRAEARKSAMNIQVSRTYRVTRKIGHLPVLNGMTYHSQNVNTFYQKSLWKVYETVHKSFVKYSNLF